MIFTIEYSSFICSKISYTFDLSHISVTKNATVADHLINQDRKFGDYTYEEVNVKKVVLKGKCEQNSALYQIVLRKGFRS